MSVIVFLIYIYLSCKYIWRVFTSKIQEMIYVSLWILFI